VLLLVDNWVELSKSIEVARSIWRTQRQNEGKKEDEHETLIFEEDVLAANEHPTVLVVEENVSQRQRLQQLLEMHFMVLSVKDGVEALQQARQHRPDLILMHPNPPRMGGEAFLKALRRHPALKETPVILLAYKDERQACLDVLEAGANDYLFVPFTRQELQFRLYNWLKLRTRERELQVLNDLLHQKTLNQMAELVRRGELLHFLPATVAQKIMSGQISGKKERFKRQKVTVLFIDIVGFTDLTGRLEPQVLSELLNEYLREMTAVANQYNGTVDKFIGDAVMVLFGAPQEKEEALQAWEAAQAALEMIRVVEGMSLIWASRLPRPLQVRVGFNTGSCTAGVFGNEMLRSYTVVGSAVNIAARLQTAAQPGSIICSRESFQHFQGRVHMRELGFLTLKGVNHPVEAIELLKLAESHESQATR
ncbi:MAG: adenylate/guanylate cyclase domain-containing response regulator, partial [Anaerolineales bacterium]|nr:adenylate/guanylate cyclase domain-containing response regulator [Anaerolineales bacterium]